MPTVKVRNIKNEEVGEVELSEAVFGAPLNEGLIHAAVRNFMANARQGTSAATLPGRLDARTVADRARQLREVGAARRRAFQAAMVGRTEDVLVLETRQGEGGELTGLTGNYIEVAFAGPDHIRRRVARVRVVGTDETAARGVLEDTRAA